MTAFSSIPGEPNFSGNLNAHLHQQFTNGSVISTPCFFDNTKTPMQATNLTPVDDKAFAGAETDRWITLDSDKTQQQYRSYEVIGDVEETHLG